MQHAMQAYPHFSIDLFLLFSSYPNDAQMNTFSESWSNFCFARLKIRIDARFWNISMRTCKSESQNFFFGQTTKKYVLVQHYNMHREKKKEVYQRK